MHCKRKRKLKPPTSHDATFNRFLVSCLYLMFFVGFSLKRNEPREESAVEVAWALPRPRPPGSPAASSPAN